ncbi:MAG TPA: TauD/TfdA family dioxygenase [Acidimicrobiales bacterium]|nr:TauD/TfdA family dioxygenase [Acidimicrobiales bacterium]
MTELRNDPVTEGETAPYRRIRVERLGGEIGAVVHGVRLGPDLDPEAVRETGAALLAHRVVFLRGQQHATDDDQRAFASLLGPLTKAHPTVGDGDVILPVNSEDSKANSWHTDVTFVDRVPSVSILRAITLPPYGGSTCWANTVNAYAKLPEGLKMLAATLRALHSNVYDYAAERPQIGGLDVKQQEYRQTFRKAEFQTEHPVVRVHPVTGEPAFLLGHFVRSFVGYSTHDFNDLFGLFQRHITKLENTVRWNWQDGDIAIWDNRATQHYAVADYDAPRLLHRVTLAGDVPVGINGDVSIVRKGDASQYSSVAA